MRRQPWFQAAIAIGIAAVAPASSGGCGCGDGGSGQAEEDGGESDAGEADAGSGGSDAGSDDAGDADDDGPPQVSECRQPTLAVYEGLRRSCVGCHDEGTNSPIFSEFAAFERLVAYNTGMVVPGDPGASLLVEMLEGNAPPPLDQMPPGAVSFAEMAEFGETDISLDEVEAWIEDVQPCDIPSGDLSPRYARRVSAEHIQHMMSTQLQLSVDDVQHVSRFPVDDPVFGYMTNAFNSSGEAWARWAALGGPHYLRGAARNSGWSPLFIQTLGPMGQAWCGRSIELGRDALFPAAGAGTTDESSVRANIEALYLDMLGVVASQDDIDAMYQDVYLHYANTENHDVAMKAVCSAFIRHPLWLTY